LHYIRYIPTIRNEVNGLLDVARRTHIEVLDDIDDLVRQTGAACGLPVTTGYNTTRRFHIQIRTNGQSDQMAKNLPPELLKVVKTRNTICCTTEDLMKLNTRMEESLEEVYILSNMVISELLTNIRTHIGCLYKLAEAVAMIDMLVSFAHVSSTPNYVRPEFTDTLAIKQGRHPILDMMLPEPPIANDVYASAVSNFLIITGPNMSGKSTYLHQVVLSQVMAQCGCFVAAEYASFRVADQIFVRMGNDDDIETNSSTFMVEMREMNYILQNVTGNSVIVIDELGRGTSTEEGVGLAHAICEHLLGLDAFTFFATHFHQLCDLEHLYPNAKNFHLQVQRAFNSRRQQETLQFSHVIAPGRTAETNYGLLLAEMTSLPESIVERARALTAQLQTARTERQAPSRQTVREHAMYRLSKRLEQTANNSRLDSESLRIHMKDLRRQFQEDLQLPELMGSSIDEGSDRPSTVDDSTSPSLGYSRQGSLAPVRSTPMVDDPLASIPSSVDRVSSNQAPRNSPPSNQLPSNQLASNQLPSNQLPSNQLASNQLPSNQLPSNQLASNQPSDVGMAEAMNPALLATVPQDD
jgi:DNA mismatch repair protein MSH4